MELETLLENFDAICELPGGVDRVRLRILAHKSNLIILTEKLQTDSKSISLKEACVFIQTGPFGSILKASDYIKDGIPIIDPQNIQNGKLISIAGKSVSDKIAKKLSKYVLKENDIVISRIGDIGKSAIVTNKEDGWICGTSMFFVRVHPFVCAKFISFWLNHPVTQTALKQKCTGATRPAINYKVLESFKICLPLLEQQKKIATEIETFLNLCDRVQTAKENRDILHKKLSNRFT